MEHFLSCLCHIVRLCAAEQGADFVTSKYTRKVFFFFGGGEKGGKNRYVTFPQHLRKHHSGLE